MISNPTRFFLVPQRRAFLVLAVVALLELSLFAGYYQERWRKSILPLGQPQTLTGEGLVIRCDGLGYYAWLRSLLIDGDWSFDNEFDEHNVLGDYVPSHECRTALGRRPNPWSVGPACAWATLVVPGHLLLKTLSRPGWPCWAMPADGYSLPYQLMVGFSTLLASFVGLGFLYGICRHQARPERAALCVAFLVLGSTIVYYNSIEGSMAHGLGTAAVAALIWYWLKTYGSDSHRRWLVVGLLTGMAALVRWQLVTYASLPIGEFVLLGWQGGWLGPGGRKRLTGAVLSALGAVIAFLPQMIAWRQVYGYCLTAPFPVAHNWLAPSWWQVVASQNRGFFYWTPVALVACAGYAVWLRAPGRRLPRLGPHVLILAAFLLQVYAVASVWGAEAYLGASYGFRQLTESVVALAPGLACVLERAGPRRFRLLCAGCCLLVLWNLILIAQYRYGWIPAAGGAAPAALLANAVQLIHRKHLLLLGQVLAGPAMLAVLAFVATRPYDKCGSCATLTAESGVETAVS